MRLSLSVPLVSIKILIIFFRKKMLHISKLYVPYSNEYTLKIENIPRMNERTDVNLHIE